MSDVIDEIVQQHAEEAAFLWQLRALAVSAPDYSLADVAELDGRVEANLDGLRIAGEPGWEVCRNELAWEEPGEVFTAAVLAFEGGDPLRAEEALALADRSPELARGVVSALGWVEWPRAQPQVQALLESENPLRVRMGIGAMAVHRVDPGRRLPDLLRHADPVVRSRALRAAGELGRTDTRYEVEASLEHEDPECRFWAAWSGVLLGDREASGRMVGRFAVEDGPHAREAADLVARSLPPAQGLGWCRYLAAQGAHRLAVIAAGAAGDASLVPWLLETMAVAELARPAGEAFSAITGMDLEEHDMEAEPPEALESGPTEEAEDEEVEMDPDENLPWPHAQRLAEWWARNHVRFAPGTRHLLGEPMKNESLLAALKAGRQRQRAAAALEIALRYPASALFEVRGPGHRQRRVLGV